MRTARRFSILLLVGEAAVAVACSPAPSSGGGGATTTTTTVPPGPPIAVGQANPSVGVSPLTVNFSANGSTTAPPGGPLAYLWSFGDGSADFSGPSPTHTYTS